MRTKLIGCVGVLVAAACATGGRGGGTTVDVGALVEESRALTLAGEWDRASERVRAAADGTGDPVARARLLAELARVRVDRSFFHRSDPADAARALEQAQRAARETQDPVSLADVLQLEGELRFVDAFTTGNFEAARKLFFEALAGREVGGDLRRLAQTNFYIGVSFEQQLRFDEARPYEQRALELAEKAGDKVWQSYAHRHLGALDEEADRIDSARPHIEQSVALRRESFPVGYPFALLQLADFVREHDQDRERERRLLEEAVTAAETSHSTLALYSAHAELVDAALDRKEPDAALRHAEQALAAARAFGQASHVTSAEEQVAKLRGGT